MIKRQRGRGRNPGQKQQNNNPNRAYESNGPDIRVRGSALTVFEKYQQLARDATSAGDRVLAENYLQHAEHYFRLLRTAQPNFVLRSEAAQQGWANEDDEDFDGDMEAGSDEGGGRDESDDSEGGAPRHNRFDREPRDREPREAREPREQREAREPRGDGDEDRFGRRRRRRRDRFGEGGGPREDDGDAPRHTQQAQHNEPLGAAEGFSAPVELAAPADGDRPRGERRPRPARPPRPPRDSDNAMDALPAFLGPPPGN